MSVVECEFCWGRGCGFHTWTCVIAVECGIFKMGHIPLKIYKTQNFSSYFGSVFSMSALKKTAYDIHLTDLK